MPLRRVGPDQAPLRRISFAFTSASASRGSTRMIARCKMSKYPGETAPSPAFIAAQPAFAGASGGSFLPDPALLSRAPASVVHGSGSRAH